MTEERADLGSRDIGELDLGDLLTVSLRDEAEEKAPGIAIRADGMDGGVALLGQPFVEEAMQ